MNGSDYTLESEGAVRRERVGACNSSEFKAEIFRVVESGQLAGCALLWRLNGKRWSPRPITTTTKAPKRTAVKREAAKARACVYVALLGAVLLLALFDRHSVSLAGLHNKLGAKIGVTRDGRDRSAQIKVEPSRVAAASA